MRLLHATRVVAALIVAGWSTRAAAVCTITGAAPTGTLPTMPVGQTFSFVATDDCTMLSFSGQDGLVRKTPRRGMAVGTTRHRYSVMLTSTEWETLLDPNYDTFTWRVMGRDAMGDVARVETTNEIDVDRDGWTRTEGDAGECDYDAARNPGETDAWGNGIDDDCNGAVDDTRLVETGLTVSTLEDHFMVGWGIATGDLDADGVADLQLATPQADAGRGAVYLVPGPRTGVVPLEELVRVTGRTGDRFFGWSVPKGDVNGDGSDDLFAGSSTAESAYVFLGPVTADLNGDSADLMLLGRDGSRAGVALEILSDFDGDGGADLVVGADRTLDAGAVYVVPGSLSGEASLIPSATHTYFAEAEGNLLGYHVVPLGDATGDGISDVAFSTPFSPDAKVYLIEGGGVAGEHDVGTAAWATLGFSTFAVAGGDYDGDGALDLLAGYDSSYGAAYAYLGPFSGAIDVLAPSTIWTTTFSGTHMGTAIAVGDVDGDNQLDVLMGAPYADEGVVAFLQPGFAEGTIDVTSLPSFAPPGGGFTDGSLATIPDWNGDGGAEIAIGTAYAGTDQQGAAHVYFSDRVF